MFIYLLYEDERADEDKKYIKCYYNFIRNAINRTQEEFEYLSEPGVLNSALDLYKKIKEGYPSIRQKIIRPGKRKYC